MTTLRQISDALTGLLTGELPERLPVPDDTNDLKGLVETLNALFDAFAEANGFLNALSEGALDVEPPRRNHLIAPFKRLHANLRHLTWQTQQVAAGDLAHQVDFLGDFSTAFNSMIESLREKRLIEKALAQSHRDVQEANAQIMDSIEYAGSIQQAILPSPEGLDAYLPDRFVLWRPRDVIGGDAYWFAGQGDEFGIAVIDCTGHGVPGAIMTMIALTTLNRVAGKYGVADPSEVLRQTNRLIKSTLNRPGGGSLYDDGLDMGMCSVNLRSKSLVFSGARIPLFLVRDGTVTEIKGDLQSVGYYSSQADHCFSLHRIDLDREASFYLTTDGLIDQIGGERKFSFGKKRFKEFILANHTKPFGEQERILCNVFRDYKGEETTLDDVTVVGFRV